MPVPLPPKMENLRPCSVALEMKGIEGDWRGLRTCRGFNPPQSLPMGFGNQTEQGLNGIFFFLKENGRRRND